METGDSCSRFGLLSEAIGFLRPKEVQAAEWVQRTLIAPASRLHSMALPCEAVQIVESVRRESLWAHEIEFLIGVMEVAC